MVGDVHGNAKFWKQKLVRNGCSAIDPVALWKPLYLSCQWMKLSSPECNCEIGTPCQIRLSSPSLRTVGAGAVKAWWNQRSRAHLNHCSLLFPRHQNNWEARTFCPSLCFRGIKEIDWMRKEFHQMTRTYFKIPTFMVRLKKEKRFSRGWAWNTNYWIASLTSSFFLH